MWIYLSIYVYGMSFIIGSCAYILILRSGTWCPWHWLRPTSWARPKLDSLGLPGCTGPPEVAKILLYTMYYIVYMLYMIIYYLLVECRELWGLGFQTMIFAAQLGVFRTLKCPHNRRGRFTCLALCRDLLRYGIFQWHMVLYTESLGI